MIEEFMGAYGGRLLVAVVGVAIGLACLAGVLWLVRGRSGPSPFVRGGKNRQPRLQVLDAAAVDTRRRLVLVRRDDTEHLIMIGGPTDIVIESGISAERRSPLPATEPPALPAEAPAVAPRAAPRPAPEIRREPLRPVVETPPTGHAAPAASVVAVEAPVVAPVLAPEAPRGRSPSPPPTSAPDTTSAPYASSAQPIRREPVLEEAADILDAARHRVLQGPAVPVPRQSPEPAAPQAEAPVALGSDFERILEEEMASNLAAREREALAPRPADKPPLTGATPEPSLQAEVARIFGEMSVTREK
ncbi:PepSY domain-containing protein [Pseudorhizobium endolithicum]|uniref:PepSY domain-containing protein n=1 Tax=Pseudorhizobium endolithicum TaxID=1191678 RepID=A0ABM8PRY6_9HYPH|nr:flagellar biosynthetic protein FliO [Pseudorhizobium endolithicum]CAD7045181.1 PepSY domain-containing protein [Pseudorhizobium endolithicum]